MMNLQSANFWKTTYSCYYPYINFIISDTKSTRVGIYGFLFLEAVAVAEDEPLHGGVITRRTKKMRKKGQI